MIKWYCDICAKEILPPENPIELRVCVQEIMITEAKDFEKKFERLDNPNCFQEMVVCKECAEGFRKGVKNLIAKGIDKGGINKIFQSLP